MFTRRHALKLAAAATATATAAPFAVSPDQASALLDRPATFNPAGGRGRGEPDLREPIAFAEALDGTDFRDFFESGAAPEMAEYKQALLRVEDAFGVLPRDLPFGHPLQDLDEAALAMWCVAWMAGVRAGAAYEHLRLAMIAPVETCRGCHGHGRTWGGSPFRSHDDGADAATCATCGGRGTVPTPAPRLTALVAD